LKQTGLIIDSGILMLGNEFSHFGTFAVLDLLEDERGITIKCDSEKGVELR